MSLIKKVTPPPFAVEVGERNISLFSFCIKEADYCDELPDLLDSAETYNADFPEPLHQNEVIATVKSVWSYKENNRLWNDGVSRAGITLEEMQQLASSPPAILLLLRLRLAHAAENNKVFCISPEIMARENSVPGVKSHNTIRKSRDLLLEKEFIIRVHKGGAHPNDPDKYRFAPYGR